MSDSRRTGGPDARTTAIGRNPLLVLRPCHRVVGADGALRGYAAGLERKRLLLTCEGAPVSTSTGSAPVRHGVGTVRAGRRRTLGLHDAA